MTNGITLPVEFLPVLSNSLLGEPNEDYVLHQFVQEKEDFTKRPGEEVLVNAPQYLPKSQNPLTDNKMDLGDTISGNEPQHLSMLQQSLTMTEHALKNALELREYEEAHSFHRLAELNGGALAVHFHAWRDSFIRERMLASTYVGFSGDYTALADMDKTVPVTIEDFGFQSTYLSGIRLIPRYPGAKYICLVDDFIIQTLCANKDFQRATTQGIQGQAPIFTGQVTRNEGYLGVVFIRTNNIPRVAAGSGSPFKVSQALMFGTGLTDMFPMGMADKLISQDRLKFYGGEAGTYAAGPVTEIVGMKPEARYGEITDFGRFKRMTYIMHGNWSVVDANPGAGKVVGRDTRYLQKIYCTTFMSKREAA